MFGSSSLIQSKTEASENPVAYLLKFTPPLLRRDARVFRCLRAFADSAMNDVLAQLRSELSGPPPLQAAGIPGAASSEKVRITKRYRSELSP